MPTLMPHRPPQAGEAPRASVMPDVGDVQDNATALTLALDALASGHRCWGCAVLWQLRAHIGTTQDVQSVQWVLPQVDTALAACAGMAARSADGEERRYHYGSANRLDGPWCCPARRSHPGDSGVEHPQLDGDGECPGLPVPLRGVDL